LEYSVQYDESCTIGASCQVQINVASPMTAPVYMYYGLQNFYQNHRRYVASRNDQQLRGESVSAGSLSDCDPRLSNSTSDSPTLDEVYFPCGLIAWSVFNGNRKN